MLPLFSTTINFAIANYDPYEYSKKSIVLDTTEEKLHRINSTDIVKKFTKDALKLSPCNIIKKNISIAINSNEVLNYRNTMVDSCESEKLLLSDILKYDLKLPTLLPYWRDPEFCNKSVLEYCKEYESLPKLTLKLYPTNGKSLFNRLKSITLYSELPELESSGHSNDDLFEQINSFLPLNNPITAYQMNQNNNLLEPIVWLSSLEAEISPTATVVTTTAHLPSPILKPLTKHGTNYFYNIQYRKILPHLEDSTKNFAFNHPVVPSDQNVSKMNARWIQSMPSTDLSACNTTVILPDFLLADIDGRTLNERGNKNGLLRICPDLRFKCLYQRGSNFPNTLFKSCQKRKAIDTLNSCSKQRRHNIIDIQSPWTFLPINIPFQDDQSIKHIRAKALKNSIVMRYSTGAVILKPLSSRSDLLFIAARNSKYRTSQSINQVMGSKCQNRSVIERTQSKQLYPTLTEFVSTAMTKLSSEEQLYLKSRQNQLPEIDITAEDEEVPDYLEPTIDVESTESYQGSQHKVQQHCEIEQGLITRPSLETEICSKPLIEEAKDKVNDVLAVQKGKLDNHSTVTKLVNCAESTDSNKQDANHVDYQIAVPMDILGTARSNGNLSAVSPEENVNNTDTNIESMVDSYLMIHNARSSDVSKVKRSCQYPLKSLTVAYVTPPKDIISEEITGLTKEQLPPLANETWKAAEKNCSRRSGHPMKSAASVLISAPSTFLDRLKFQSKQIFGANAGANVRGEAGTVQVKRVMVSERFLEQYAVQLGELASQYHIRCHDFPLEEPVSIIIDPVTAICIVDFQPTLNDRQKKRQLVRQLSNIAFKFSKIWIVVRMQENSIENTTLNEAILNLVQLSSHFPSSIAIRECYTSEDHHGNSLPQLIAHICYQTYRTAHGSMLPTESSIQEYFAGTFLSDQSVQDNNEADQQMCLFLQSFPTVNYFIAVLLLRKFTIKDLVTRPIEDIFSYLQSQHLLISEVRPMVEDMAKLLHAHIGLETVIPKI